MDLKAILSPSDDQVRSEKLVSSTSQPTTPLPAPAIPTSSNAVSATASTTSSPPQPRKFVQRALSAQGLSSSRTKHVGSPLSQTALSSALPSHVLSPSLQPNSSPLISPVPNTPGTPVIQRATSNQSIDTLADLASMQSHQPVRPIPYKGPSLDSIKSVDSSSHIALAQSSLTSNPRASFDINMMDMLKDTRRLNFANTSLSDDDQTRLSDLISYLVENPSAYESHVAAINLLHRAFINFVFPTSSSGEHLPRASPATFDLLDELRNARKEMEKLFAVGETIWLDWLQDESMVANTTEERIDVIESFRRAITDEPLSCKLWVAYGDWVLECYRWAHDSGSAGEVSEEKLIGREVFSWQMVMDTWQDAVDNTKDDLASSHLVWNKHMELRISDFKNGISKEKATETIGLFEQRLRTPHVDSDSTKQLLSAFMNEHFSQEQYFEIMGDTVRIMKDALRMMEERSIWEARLEDAEANGDKILEYNTFVEYIEWEKSPAKRKRTDFDLVNALYQRLELKFPSDTALWEDHITYLLEQKKPALDVLSRATKHCPWSGSLWSQFLLTSDRQGRSYEETEGIKHKATSTGVLEAAGIEEVLKVHSSWCSYLRRRACRPDRDEDDADIAEIGIRTSMENISNHGAKLSIGEAPDPSFRLQRIYINFLSESGRWDNARQEFDNAVRDYGRSWQFWMRFYHWEMMRWRTFAVKGGRDDVPRLATAVLKTALEQDGLDYPEPIIEALGSHCEDYEDVDEMQACLLKVRKYEKILAARRQVEAAQQSEAAAAAQNIQESSIGDAGAERPQLSKRKRDFNDSDETLHDNFKKSRTDEETIETVEQKQPENPKRDRENATILVENLPENLSESKLRQYFSSCGVVKSIKMLDHDASALVEFEDDQAAQYALSRDGQQFENAILSVTLDTGSTVFLTNYSPTADEKEVRALLEPYGEILSARFPSLQGNKKRRFCYIQFKLPTEAQEAVKNLDEKVVNGFALICKISNPGVKKPRKDNSVNDGRTIFIGGLNFKASEEEVKKTFERYGKVILIRMPLHEALKNRNRGFAFVTYESKEEAQSALEMNGQEVKERDVKVEIAVDHARSARHASTPARTNGARNHRSTSPTGNGQDLEPRSERTIFLTSLPDTVNEARLRQLATKYGEVVKCVLKTNHQGAVLEYASVAQAGEAALALDGHEIADGRKINVVSEQEMKTHGPEKKTEEVGSKPKITTMSAPASGFIKRPTQANNRGRKGGNLGRRTGLPSSGPEASAPPRKDAEETGLESKPKKSNDDFRALMNQRGGEGKEKEP